MKQIISFDIAKGIMCIMVVAIHTMGFFGPYPFLRIAVPMYFSISSYLFFRKLNGVEDQIFLIKFVMRNLKLYSFWFFVLLIPTLLLGGWLQGNIVLNAIKFFFRIFLGSTFAASWFIPALIISVMVIYYSRKSLPYWCLFLITGFIYGFCCIFSNYRGLLSEKSMVYKLMLLYPGTIYNSFPVGLFWVALGSYLASVKINIGKRSCLIGAAIATALLILEYYLIKELESSVDNDCYFMLIPVVFFLMIVLISFNISINSTIARKIRELSTVTFCLHGTIASVLKICFFSANPDKTDAFLCFFITLSISVIVGQMILKLEKARNIKWLSISH